MAIHPTLKGLCRLQGSIRKVLHSQGYGCVCRSHIVLKDVHRLLLEEVEVVVGAVHGCCCCCSVGGKWEQSLVDGEDELVGGTSRARVDHLQRHREICPCAAANTAVVHRRAERRVMMRRGGAISQKVHRRQGRCRPRSTYRYR